MPNHHIALGRVVHYVADDYECPAMMVGTPRHFKDDEDVQLQYGADRHVAISRKAVTLQVNHPFDEPFEDMETQEKTFQALITIKADSPHRNGRNPPAGSWHWSDECYIGGRL